MWYLIVSFPDLCCLFYLLPKGVGVKERFLKIKELSIRQAQGWFFQVYFLFGTLSEQVCLRDLLWGLFSFCFFVNDIVSGIDSNTRLFADDTSFFIIVEKCSLCCHLLK